MEVQQVGTDWEWWRKMLNIHKPPRNKHNCCPTSDLWGWTEIINQGLPKRRSCGWLRPDRPTRKWGWFMIKACKHKHKHMLKHKVTHRNIQVRTVAELPCWLYILALMRVRWPGPFRVRGKGQSRAELQLHHQLCDKVVRFDVSLYFHWQTGTSQ